MINTVQSSVPLDDAPDRRDDRRQPGKDAPSAQTTKPVASDPDLRLVIEQDEAKGMLIYKLIDRATGKVVSHTTREDLLKMSADPDYTAGQVIRTKA